MLPSKRKDTYSFTECSSKRRISNRDITMEDDDMSSPIPSPTSSNHSFMEIEHTILNEQEYIVFCIDLDEEINYTFKQTVPRLDHIKKALSLFVRSKLKHDPNTKFAICILRVSAIWFMDFTSEFNEIKSKLNSLKHGGKFNAFDMTTLFDTLENTYRQIVESKQSVRLIQNSQSSGPSTPIPMNWNLRVIFIYSRSSIIPQYLGGTTSLDSLKKNQNFSFESIYMYHMYHTDHGKIIESISQATKNISKISDQSSIRKFYYCFLGILFVPPSQRPSTPKYQRFPVGLINENLDRLGPCGKNIVSAKTNQPPILSQLIQIPHMQGHHVPMIFQIQTHHHHHPNQAHPQAQPNQPVQAQQVPAIVVPIVPNQAQPQAQPQAQQNPDPQAQPNVNTQPIAQPPPQQQNQTQVEQPAQQPQQPIVEPPAPQIEAVEPENNTDQILPPVGDENEQPTQPQPPQPINNDNTENNNPENNLTPQPPQPNAPPQPEVAVAPQVNQQPPIQIAVAQPAPLQPHNNIFPVVYYPVVIPNIPNPAANPAANPIQENLILENPPPMYQPYSFFVQGQNLVVVQQQMQQQQQAQQQQAQQPFVSKVNKPNQSLRSSSDGEEPTTLPSLGSMLKPYINSTQFSDVVFLVGKTEDSEGEMIYGHKVILSARSKYFKALFTNGMRESGSKGEIVVPGVSRDVFLALLCYLYTDDLTPMEGSLPSSLSKSSPSKSTSTTSTTSTGSNSVNTPPSSSTPPAHGFSSSLLTELLILANQYMLDGLKIKCCELIGETLSVNNLVSLMNLASIHEATELKNSCILYFYSNLPIILRDCLFENDINNEGSEALGFLIVDYFSKVSKLSSTDGKSDESNPELSAKNFEELVSLF